MRYATFNADYRRIMRNIRRAERAGDHRRLAHWLHELGKLWVRRASIDWVQS
jgi:hypothetical protein